MFYKNEKGEKKARNERIQNWSEFGKPFWPSWQAQKEEEEEDSSPGRFIGHSRNETDQERETVQVSVWIFQLNNLLWSVLVCCALLKF